MPKTIKLPDQGVIKACGLDRIIFRISAPKSDRLRESWVGKIQVFLEARIDDAPDETCREFAKNLWQETAEFPAVDAE